MELKGQIQVMGFGRSITKLLQDLLKQVLHLEYKNKRLKERTEFI
jgi:hypothetical protein